MPFPDQSLWSNHSSPAILDLILLFALSLEIWSPSDLDFVIHFRLFSFDNMQSHNMPGTEERFNKYFLDRQTNDQTGI